MARDFTKASVGNYMSPGINQIAAAMNGAAFVSGLCKFTKDTNGTGGDSDFICCIPINNTTTGLHWRTRSGSANVQQVTARSVGADSAQSVSGATLTTGVNYSGGFSLDYANDDMFLYLDGASDGTNTVAGFASTLFTAGAITTAGESIGSFFNSGTSPDGTDRQFDGSLAELAIYAGSALLTANDHAAYADGVSPLLIKPHLLVFYAPLLGRGTHERDVIGNRTLTITGTIAQRSRHPSMHYQSRPRMFTRAAAPAAPVTGFGSLLGMRRNHLIRSA